MIRSIILAGLVAAMLTSPTVGATSGAYMSIGGLGGIPCTIFTNSVAEARERFGLSSVDALNALDGYIEYAMGFLLGYNALVDGVYDIAASIRGAEMPISILTITDNHCRLFPTDVYDDAVIDLAKKLRPSALTVRP